MTEIFKSATGDTFATVLILDLPLPVSTPPSPIRPRGRALGALLRLVGLQPSSRGSDDPLFGGLCQGPVVGGRPRSPTAAYLELNRRVRGLVQLGWS